MNTITTPGVAVVITVELFGMARVHAGVGSIELAVGPQAPVPELIGALARQCPGLIGSALRRTDDGTVAVADGYALNRNGLVFLPPDTHAPLNWAAGDSLLLLSNQAGG